MAEITAAHYPCEKSQLPVLASAALYALQKPPGASASSAFLCDAHRQLGTWQCRSGKVLNKIPNQLNSIRVLLCLFKVCPGWHPLTSGRSSPQETQPVDLEVWKGKEKPITNKRVGFILFNWIIIHTMFYLALQTLFSQPAVIFLKMPFTPDHLTSTSH